jgi:hypothetical protein
LLLKVTVIPPEGVTPVSVTVPVAEAPPLTVDGLIVTEAGVGASTVRIVEAEFKFAEAVSFELVGLATGTVVTVKLAVRVPAATVTEGGAEAALLEDASVTFRPTLGAAPFNLTVPLALAPPTTLVGVTVTVPGDGGFTVRGAVRLLPPRVALIDAATWPATGDVVTLKVAVAALAGTVTEAGVFTDAEEDTRVTTTPPDGAAAFSVTVPFAPAPPTTVEGAIVNPDRLCATAKGDRQKRTERSRTHFVAKRSHRKHFIANHLHNSILHLVRKEGII